MKISLVLALLIWGILLFGFYGAGNLSLANYHKPGGICPKLIGVPACYIILSCLIVAGIGQLTGSNWAYFLATGLAAGIAIAGTIGQLSGVMECPKTGGGTPMCYLSLTMFGSLILLKVVSLIRPG